MMQAIMVNNKNKIKTFTTQQYEVGLYLIIDNDSTQQMSLDVKEDKFHNDLRSGKILKGNWKVQAV